MMCEGIAAELEGIDLGDKRLNRRSQVIIEALGANPEASCNSACDGWSDALGAYRFFDNKSVGPEDILKPHLEATKRRIKEHSVALIAQDTTELDYSDHPPTDARCLNQGHRLGLYDHTHLAVTPSGLSLGVVGVEYFDRQEEYLGKSKERSKLPIEEKESLRWLTGYYVARWTIEVFFRVFKTGCRVEEIQLETLSRLKNCLAFYKIIAWRIMYLTYLNRECPTLPCDVVFDECEWKSVWRVVTKTDLPRTPPPLSEFMPLLAQLGGYNNRKSESPPGPQPVWVGIRRMTDFATAWINFGPGAENTYV